MRLFGSPVMFMHITLHKLTINGKVRQYRPINAISQGLLSNFPDNNVLILNQFISFEFLFSISVSQCQYWQIALLVLGML